MTGPARTPFGDYVTRTALASAHDAGRAEVLGVLQTAARDRRLHGRTLALLVLLHQELSPAEYRPAKVTWLAKRTQMRHQHVSRSLRCLVTAGYLVRGPDERLQGCSALATYRLSDPTETTEVHATPP